MHTPHKPKQLASSRPLPADVMHYRDGYEAQNGTVVQFQTEWTKQHQLEGDGLLPLLYDHLWKSDITREHRLRDAMIPDTIVFEHNFPRAWYTYDAKAQEIVKRAGKLLDSHSIYKFFGTEEKGCDIVAQFYYKSTTVPVAQRTPRSGQRSPQRNGGGGKGDVEEELTTSVEFFTKEQFFHFIHSAKMKPDGVLQKFLVCKGDSQARRSFEIQAVWSPLATLIYKRTNKHRLNDKSIPVADRAATFDGPPHCSEESIVADSTKSKITDLCEKIVQHFSVTEHKPITRIILYFKTDNMDRIWVLWASSLRIGGDRLNPSNLRVPLQLGIRVENSNAGTSRGEVETRRRVVQSQLLDKDIALYDLTGDWTFAGQCVSSHRHHSIQSRSGSPSSPTNINTNSPQRDKEEQPPSPLKVEPRRESCSKSVAEEDAAAASATRRSTEALYMSSRAPFLPTIDRQEKVTVQSPRHPLHHIYVKAHAHEGKSHTEHNTSASANSSRTYFARRQQEDANLKMSQRVAKPTELQACKDDLVVASHDLVYQSYCRVIDHCSSTVAEKGAIFDLPDVVLGCLTNDQIASLAVTLGAVWEPEDDQGMLVSFPVSHIGRGRRKDRPAAQVFDDVNAFYDGLFTNYGLGILDKYQQYLERKAMEWPPQRLQQAAFDRALAKNAATEGTARTSTVEEELLARSTLQDARTTALAQQAAFDNAVAQNASTEGAARTSTVKEELLARSALQDAKITALAQQAAFDNAVAKNASTEGAARTSTVEEELLERTALQEARTTALAQQAAFDKAVAQNASTEGAARTSTVKEELLARSALQDARTTALAQQAAFDKAAAQNIARTALRRRQSLSVLSAISELRPRLAFVEGGIPSQSLPACSVESLPSFDLPAAFVH